MKTIACLISVVLVSLSPGLRPSADTSVTKKKLPAEVVGSWKTFASRSNGNVINSVLLLKKKDGKYSGTLTRSSGNESEVGSVTFKNNRLKIETSYNRDGETWVIGVRADLNEEGELKGNWYVEDSVGAELRSEAWKAVRLLTPVLAGTWQMTAKTDDQDYRMKIEFTRAGEEFTAEAINENGDGFPLDELKVEENKLSFEANMDNGSKVKVEAKLKAAKKLSGKYRLYDACGVEASSGNWEAAK